VARLCLACQTTMGNRVQHCPLCGRNVTETERAWARGIAAWRAYLEATGWYPHRRDEWVERRWQALEVERSSTARPGAPSRLVSRYLGGHPRLSRASRVVLTRADGAVIIAAPGWWPTRVTRVAVPLAAVRSVSSQRTTESTPDEAIVTAAIGGARTGPLGMAFGAAVGRRRRLMRTVHVHVELDNEAIELVFRPLDDQGDWALAALGRMFKKD
jgi:hypothetical protein